MQNVSYVVENHTHIYVVPKSVNCLNWITWLLALWKGFLGFVNPTTSQHQRPWLSAAFNHFCWLCCFSGLWSQRRVTSPLQAHYSDTKVLCTPREWEGKNICAAERRGLVSTFSFIVQRSLIISMNNSPEMWPCFISNLELHYGIWPPMDQDALAAHTPRWQ